MPFRGKNPHKLTDDDRAKGRKVKSRRRSITSSIKRRKWCREDCPLWPCLFQPLSTKREFGGKCALKFLKEDKPGMYRQYMNIILKGKEGLQKELAELLSRMVIDSHQKKAKFKEKYFTIKAANEFTKIFYPNPPANIEANISYTQNNLNLLIVDTLKEMEEKGLWNPKKPLLSQRSS